MKLLARAVPATAAVILTAGLADCTGGAAGSGSGGPPGSGAATPSTSDRSRSANPDRFMDREMQLTPGRNK